MCCSARVMMLRDTYRVTVKFNVQPDRGSDFFSLHVDR